MSPRARGSRLQAALAPRARASVSQGLCQGLDPAAGERAPGGPGMVPATPGGAGPSQSHEDKANGMFSELLTASTHSGLTWADPGG